MVLPGYLGGDLPRSGGGAYSGDLWTKNIRQLPEFFGSSRASARRLWPLRHRDHRRNQSRRSLVAGGVDSAGGGAGRARADVIDTGCSPGHRWGAVGDATRHFNAWDCGSRSIPSIRTRCEACRAGAELVLSVNSQNCELAKSWGCEVVAVPDTPNDLASLRQTVDCLDRHGVPYRIDPIVEPIGLGFAASLERYIRVAATGRTFR